jgi:hypothetical protein
MRLGTMIGAVATATALMAIWAAAPASATVMCKVDFEEEAICPKESVYPVGTGFSISLKPGTSSKLNVGFTTVTCEESKMSGEITNAGELTATLSIGMKAVSFGKCNATVEIAEVNGFTFHWGVSSNNTRGYGTVDSVKTSVVSGGVNCTYGGETIKGEKLMAIAGEPGQLQATEVELPKLAGSFMCAKTAKWTATYTINAPSPFSLSAG